MSFRAARSASSTVLILLEAVSAEAANILGQPNAKTSHIRPLILGLAGIKGTLMANNDFWPAKSGQAPGPK
jgi:hypothetical protein